MLLTDNIVLRYCEWRDRANEMPDLVPRMRRLWSAERSSAASKPGRSRRLLALRHRAALHVPRGA